MKYFKIFLILAFLSTLFGCGQKGQKTEDGSNTVISPKTKRVKNIEATTDQKERRSRSEKICKSKGVPIYKNPNSLFVQPEQDVELRTKDEVVDRAMALLYLGLKSEGMEQVQLDKVNEVFEISSKLTSKEKEYALAKNPTEQQQAYANWRYESLHVLLWSLGFIDNLIYPDQMCIVADDVKIIFELGIVKFREQAKLRSKEEILNEADLILRLDWACVSARVKNQSVPAGLNSSVVYERHYSLNWLIKFMNQNWDNVTTDT